MIAEEIGREELPESVWDILVYRGHVEAYQEGLLNRVGLVRYARALLFYAKFVEQLETSESKDEHLEIDAPHVGENERDRSKALVEYLKLKVASHPEVLKLLNEYVQDGEPFTEVQAFELMQDSDVRKKLSRSLNRSLDDKETPSGELEFFCKPNKTQRVEFYAGSFFERLNEVGERLRKEIFPFWTKAEASWAAITGEVKAIEPVTWRIESRVTDHVTFGTISITAEPWIPAETVTNVYQHLQAQVLRRRPRPVSRRNLSVLRFVVEQLQELIATMGGMAEPPRVSWSRMMERWNREHPESAYSDQRKFYRDCHRTGKIVVRPYDPIDLLEGTHDFYLEKPDTDCN